MYNDNDFHIPLKNYIGITQHSLYTFTVQTHFKGRKGTEGRTTKQVQQSRAFFVSADKT